VSNGVTGNTLRAKGPLVVAAGLAALALAAPALALDVPVGQIHALAQGYEPGVLLPTVFPKSITMVDVGAGSGIGNGPPPAHFLAYHTPTREAFQMGIWRGGKRAAVVAGLRFHDGSHGSTRAFTAGRFSGTVEIQRPVSASKPNVVSYVWQSGGYTYMLAYLSKPGTTTSQFAGFAPLKTISSFKR
jgi:hypothetical protein